MQAAVVPNAPPANLRFLALQRQPGRDVGLMIHIRHDDLPPLAERLTDTLANKTNERCSIHAKRDLVWVVGVDEIANAFACAGHSRVNLSTLFLGSAALNIAIHKVRSDRIQDTLRDLRAGGVVEENEILALHERPEISAEIFDREFREQILSSTSAPELEELQCIQADKTMETAHSEKQKNSKMIQQTPGCILDKAMVPGGEIYSRHSQGHRENSTSSRKAQY
jgi:hypothetical protein